MDGELHYLVTIDYVNLAYLFNEHCEPVAELLLDSDDARKLLRKGEAVAQVKDEIWKSSLDWVSASERQRAGCYLLPADARY